MITRTWQLRTSCTDPYHNLALEELLWQEVQPGECILYLWQNRHTVVIGRNQDCWKECDVDALEADGGQLARRMSGGGAVYHDMGNLNFTFLLNKGDYNIPRQLSVVVEACRFLGIPAEASGRNDLTVHGRKFSGNAFYESGERCYHHGTLLLRANLTQLDRFLNVSQDKLESKGVRSARSRVINLCEYVPDLTVDQMCEKLLEAFGTIYLPAKPLPKERVNKNAVSERAAFYASEKWRFGQRCPSGLKLSHRFPWGDFQLYAAIRDGRLTDVRIFSDAMDCDFISGLPQRLEGVRFSARTMADAVSPAGEQAGSLAKWLLNAVQPERRETPLFQSN